MLIYVVSSFDVILDIPVFLARDSWNRLARPGLNAQLRRRAAVLRPRRACQSQPLAAAVTGSTYSTRTAWYRNTESDSSCSVAKFDKNWLFILSWPEGGAFADFVSTAAKSQPRPFFILMQGALSSRGILHSKLRFPFSLQFWFGPNFVTLVLAVVVFVVVVVVVVVVGGGGGGGGGNDGGRSVDHQDAKRKQRQGIGCGCALAHMTVCQNLEAYKLYSSLGVVGWRGQGGCATRRPSDWARVPFAAARPHIAACLIFILLVSTGSNCSIEFIVLWHGVASIIMEVI